MVRRAALQTEGALLLSRRVVVSFARDQWLIPCGCASIRIWLPEESGTMIGLSVVQRRATVADRARSTVL